ncbi:hypothetical protein D3C87_2016060 [compost metagenome]
MRGKYPSTPITNTRNAIANSGPIGQKGTGNFRSAISAGLILRRIATCDNRIINHTHTVAKVAIDAISTNTSSGIR